MGKFVLLHDVPLYTQGSQDLACGWYCAVMMLGALKPGFLEDWWTKKQAVLPDWKTGDVVKPSKLKSWLGDLVGDWQKASNSSEAQTVINNVVAAIEDGRPSILQLPQSPFHPEGHYVVVKGCLPQSGKTPRIRTLLVNDPLSGEGTLLATANLFEPYPDWSDKALIAQETTWLRRVL